MTTFDATIERRLLVNYRADADVAGATLPPPFRPQIVDGSAVVGVCILRAGSLRPPGAPTRVGRTADSIAVRVAVEWDTSAGLQRAVYIERRLTAARPWSVARRVPGVHGVARIHHDDDGDDVATIALDEHGAVIADVRGTIGTRDEQPVGAGGRPSARPLFAGSESADAFFAAAPTGWSPWRGELVGWSLEASTAMRVVPVHLVRAETCFDVHPNFPAGSVAFDSAYLMRGVTSRWRSVRWDASPGERRHQLPWSRHAVPAGRGHPQLDEEVTAATGWTSRASDRWSSAG